MICQVAFFICRQVCSIIMETSQQIIEEIKSDASGIQRKLLTLPVAGEECNPEQQNAIDQAQKGLLGWRSWDLGELEKAFSGKS